MEWLLCDLQWVKKGIYELIVFASKPIETHHNPSNSNKNITNYYLKQNGCPDGQPFDFCGIVLL